jgi:hypothetical protein
MLQFSVSDWVDLFESIGLNDKQIKSWHQLFEQRYPEAHQSFLEWLGLSEAKIAEMRNNYS